MPNFADGGVLRSQSDGSPTAVFSVCGDKLNFFFFFTFTVQSFSWQTDSYSARLCYVPCNYVLCDTLYFYVEALSDRLQITNLEDHPFSVVRLWRFRIFTVAPIYDLRGGGALPFVCTEDWGSSLMCVKNLKFHIPVSRSGLSTFRALRNGTARSRLPPNKTSRSE
jgi:hypothetical protein